MTDIICGVDVSSQTLEARIGLDGPSCQVARSHEGVAELAAFCRTHAVKLVAMEATGGYERLPFALLWAAGLPCALANPRQVRHFAEAMGRLEKTDRIDAGLIAAFAAAKGLKPLAPASQAQRQLTARVVRLGQITALVVAQTHQRRLADDPDLKAGFDALLTLLRAQARQIEAEIATLVAADPLWTRLDEAFRSIKGVAGRTVARLLAQRPEIGLLSGKAVAKLAGLAPLAHDSGTLQGRRRIRGGRRDVRAVLFVVAQVVRRHEPDFAAFHTKLSQAGKPKKAIRIALARKLLVRLNAKARDVRNLKPQPA